MKQFYLLFFLQLFFLNGLLAQDPQTHQVPSIEFPDLESVVNYINSEGPGENGLLFEIAGNSTFTESSLMITTSGTVNAPIILLWNGEGEKPVINFSGTSATDEAGFIFLGVSYITLDGLDIRNPDGMLEYGIFMTNSSPTQGSQFNIIKNTHITLNKENTNLTNAVRVLSTQTQGSALGSNSNNHFLNNHISNTLIAYYFDSVTGEVDLMDTGNWVGTESEGNHIIEDIVMCGVYLIDQNGATIDNTEIRNLNRPNDGTASAPAAISTTGSLPSGPLTNPFVISRNNIHSQYAETTTIFGMYLNQRNAVYNIHSNRLDNITTDGTGGIYASGIFVFASSVIANIYNNMLSGIAAPLSTLTSAAATRGIDVRTYSEANIYYNSVHLAYTATNNGHRSATLNIHNTSDPVDIRNNIFVNNTVFAPEVTGIITTIHKNTNSIANIANSSDNNIYYAGVPSPSNLILYGHNSTAPAADQTLEDYQARTETFDQGSFTENVPFLATNNLHIDPYATTVVRNNAQYMTSPFTIAEDINGKLRDTETPDIGAQELPLAYPAIATDPVPADGAENVEPEDLQLQWQYHPSLDYANPTGFKVYFGTETVPGEEQYLGWIDWIEGVSDYSLALEATALDYETTYYWMVIPSDDAEVGPDAQDAATWSFTTVMFTWDYPNAAIDPTPADEAIDVIIGLQDISWKFVADPEYTQPTGFMLYFGDDELLQEEDFIAWVAFDENIEEYNFDVAHMTFVYNTSYFWKVVPAVTADEGPFAEDAAVWSFTIEDNVSAPGILDDKLSIYPNPAQSVLHVNFPGNYTLQIIAMDGTVYLSEKYRGTQKLTDIAHLPAGNYLLRIISEEQTLSRIIQIIK